MLILSRRRRESFYLTPSPTTLDLTLRDVFKGNSILITVTDIQKGAVRLAIAAPDGLMITRKELVDKE